MSSEWFLWLGLVLAIAGVILFFWMRPAKRPIPPVVEPSVASPPAEAFPDRLKGALARTRGHWWTGLSKFTGKAASALSSGEWNDLEEALLQADVSVAASQRLLLEVREKSRGSGAELSSLLQAEVEKVLDGVESGWVLPATPRPFVISIVGVNGVGKTTTVGKLAYRFSQDGKKVLIGACDSFRAAAIEQLRVWADRSGSQFVAGREGADPGATAFDAIAAGKSREMDVVLLDTAGRLHTKTHLMDELKRVHKVATKVMPDAPHQVWLVLDGTLGQNSVVQAKQFHEALGVTGVIVTKLDGTAKGGSVLSIASDLKLPVRFIGVGETAGDLVPFEPAAFAEALLAR